MLRRRNSARGAGHRGVRRAWLAVRSALLWAVSGLHFFLLGALLVVLDVFLDTRKHDSPQRLFFRNILRLAGVKFEVIRSPGFDPRRTSIFICNHVNLFDPFVIYCAIPQFVRGFELESHFRIPVYGWMMGRFGNIPVPDKPSREGLEAHDEDGQARARFRHKPDRVSRSRAYARRPHGRVQERSISSGAAV